MKRRRLLLIAVLLALPFVLGACGFLRNEFWTLDVASPPVESGDLHVHGG